MELLITVGQLVLSLSILIVLHEFGHFLPARAFGTRVEKFYLFFDPYFSLFKKKIGDTEWGIGWLPLGGYVKIAGMIDESMDKEQMALPPKPDEFRSKPAWQRLIIMLGGVTVNFILGFLIFGLVLWGYGEKYLPAENATAGIVVTDSLGTELGLETGDHILSIGTVPFDRFNPGIVTRAIAIEGQREITLRRDGRQIDLPVADKWSQVLTKRKNQNTRLFGLRVPFAIGEVPKDSHNADVDLNPGEIVEAVNGIPTPYMHEMIEQLAENKDQTVRVLLRDTLGGGQTREVELKVNENGKIGIAGADPEYFYQHERIDYSFGEALPAGVTKGVDFLGTQFKAFGKMFSGDIELTESLGGFISIGKMFGSTWNWERFWIMTASLSLILAFMNLLPIPALDGGHVVFLLYEVISGRKPSDKFMEVAQLIGFIIVIGLVLLANGLDIWNAIKGWLGIQ